MFDPTMAHISAYSSMTGSLGGSMSGSCLQQRAEGYPAYVFHEPLHYQHHTGISGRSGIPTTSHHTTSPGSTGAQTTGPAPYNPATSTTGTSTRALHPISYMPQVQEVLSHFLIDVASILVNGSFLLLAFHALAKASTRDKFFTFSRCLIAWEAALQ